MRTTVTIDPDVEALLNRAMKQRGVSFKEALNTALRAGLMREDSRRVAPRPLPTFDMQLRPAINLDKALSLSTELEDEETTRKLLLGK